MILHEAEYITCKIYIAFRMAAVHLKNYYFRIDCFLPFKLRLLLLSFAAINAKYINFETQRAIQWYVLKQNSKEIFELVSWLTVNAKLKTSGNFVELEGSQPQNNNLLTTVFFKKKTVSNCVFHEPFDFDQNRLSLVLEF